MIVPAGLLIAGIVIAWSSDSDSVVVPNPAMESADGDVLPGDSLPADSDPTSDVGGIQSLTMAEVIGRATAVRDSMSKNLQDYTARFVKQERNDDGVLGEETIMTMKVQSKLRSEDDQAPMRVFLRFEAPQSQAGRKVIWGEDLYDGKMAVHETGMLLSLKTIYLDPNGLIAMQGQKHPISEIGLVKLVEKLIERGAKDVDSPDLQITLTPDHDFNDRKTELLRVVRSKPTDDEDDFQVAEIVLDPGRQLILRYRSFGWPENDSDDPPLLESYTYEDVEINVALTDTDFDVKNPEYGYPAF